MSATGIGVMFASMHVHAGYGNESKCIQNQSGTGENPVPKRIPVFAAKPFSHVKHQKQLRAL